MDHPDHDLLRDPIQDEEDLTTAALSNTKPLVGVTGFEPATSSSRTKRATKLRHTPMVHKTRPPVSRQRA